MEAKTERGPVAPSTGIGRDVQAMLNPAALLGLLRMEPCGRSEQARPPCLSARAHPRPWARERRLATALYPLGFGAEVWIIDVDVERGVLLRSEALIAGHAFCILEALSIEFDRPNTPDTFAVRGHRQPARTCSSRGAEK